MNKGHQVQRTTERIGATLEVLARHSNLTDALSELSGLGLCHTKDALYSMLRKRGLGSPTTHLAPTAVRDFIDRRPEPASDEPPPDQYDDDDGPPTLRDGWTLRPDPGSDVSRILFVPDTHRPFHDKPAWELMLRAARQLRPDVVVILGDFADFYAVSAHDKNPKRVTSLEAEIEDVKEGLDDLGALGARRMIYVSGNHEWRLDRYLMAKAPALFGMLSLPEILGLAERGIEWVPYMHSTRVGHLTVTHDVGEAGIYAVKRARDAAEGNIVIGHVHAMGVHYSGSARGVVRVGAAFGWLGKFEEAGDYIHAIKSRRAWCHGFGVGTMERDGTVHLQAVPIINGKCVVNGELIH